MKGNRGEWSEVYVFLKLLADGKLCAADADLKKIQNICYPVLEILRRAGKDADTRKYVRNGTVTVLDGSGNQLVSGIPIDCFIKYAELLLSEIKTSGGPSFSVPSVEPFLRKIGCTKLKAGSGSKSDIIIKVHDLKTGFDPEYGFSIKSRLGKASTLLNASKSTNFIYHIYNRNELENYLLKNTRIEQPDRGRHKFGDLYGNNGNYSIKLNLQIRFKK